MWLGAGLATGVVGTIIAFRAQKQMFINSAVGLDVAMPDGMSTVNDQATGDVVVTKCWSNEQPAVPMPDRVRELEKLLTATESERQKCGKFNATLMVTFQLDTEGQVSKVLSNKNELGTSVATCVEAALLAEIAFAPSPSESTVPIRLELGS